RTYSGVMEISALAPESLQAILVANTQGEPFAEGVVGNAGVLAKGGVNMLRPEPDAFLLVARQRLRIKQYMELLLIGGAQNPVALDGPAQEHDRADRPVVLAVAVVVVGGAAHLALDDYDQAVANLEILGPAYEVADAGEELGDEFHLIDIVVRV